MSPLARGAIIGGGLAGVGAVLWGAAAYFSGWEAGALGVVVGALAGFGMAQGTAWKGSAAAGAVAALIGALAVMGGKFGVAQVQAQHWSAESVRVGDEEALKALADRTYQRFLQEGRNLMRPDGTYGVEVWSVARRQWANMKDSEKSDMLEDLRSSAAASARQAASVGIAEFVRRVHGLDGVYLALAAAAAFGLGWFNSAAVAAQRSAPGSDVDLLAANRGGSALRPPPADDGRPSIAAMAAKGENKAA
jgi:hypothetical protein